DLKRTKDGSLDGQCDLEFGYKNEGSKSALRIDNAKVKVMESLDEDGSNLKKLNMSCVVGENEIQRFNSSPI
ncbi:503_t:CDS:2, partial [Racocetra persica]